MDIPHTIDKLDKKMLCTGCSACYNACPENAISMIYNDEGFLEPVIDKEKCVSCGKCEKVCTALHPKKDNDKEPLVYAVKGSKRILKESTSGGVFAVLAEYVLSKGGYVCGAAYNEAFEVSHVIENTSEGVKRIKRSKYIQSEIGLIYRKLEELLKNDSMVLFSGTPCQVMGLHNFLGKPYENLYTLDIICRGCPAPMSWKRYVEENLDITKVSDIEFRHKGKHGFRKNYISIHYKNGKEDIVPANKNPYYYHCRKDLGLRRSCAFCEGAVLPRVGDFSAGDFWGAGQYFAELIDDDVGISVMYFNNEHAKELIPYLEKEFALMKPITLEQAVSGNRSKQTKKMHVNRDRFFDMLKTETFNEAIRKNIGIPFDVAIYGKALEANYGGALSYYALYKAVLNMGYGAVMIRPPKKNEEAPASNIARFLENNAVLSDELPLASFDKHNKLSDIFLLGSDQVWNYSLFKAKKLSFYFDFVDDKKKKIAYGASFGGKKPTLFPDYAELYPEVTRLIRRFDAIGVCGTDGVEVCKNYFGVGAKQLLDAIFLIKPEEYIKLSENAKKKTESPFMSAYIHSQKDGAIKGLSYISKKLGINCINIGMENDKKQQKKAKKAELPIVKNLTVEDWLYHILHSEFVVTDSYHCVCVAILLRKNFIAIQDSGNFSDLRSLLVRLNLNDRLVKDFDGLKDAHELITKDIDYDAVHEILNREIEDSLEWLKKVISKKKNVTELKKVSIESGAKSEAKDFSSTLTANMYIKAIKNRRRDMVVVAVRKGDKILKLKDIKKFKKLIDFEKFGAVIFDSGADKSVIGDAKEFGNISYELDGILISVTSGGKDFEDDGRYTEIAVEKGRKRQIYLCEKQGIYFLIYSKKAKQVIDFVRIDKRGLLHR